MKSLSWVFVLVLSLTSAAFAQNGGYAVKFNGVDGYANMTLNTSSSSSTATLEMWFSPASISAGTVFIADLHSISGADVRRRVMPFLAGGVIGIYCAPNVATDANAISQSTGVSTSPNVWYHIAITINGSTLKMYVDGKLYVTTSLTDAYSLTGTELLCLATDYWNTTYGNIKVDEVRVWNTERTEAQIKANMFKELTGSEAGLISYYKMSNGSGGKITDNSASASHDGSLIGGSSWIPSAAFADSRNSLYFDGIDDYVDCGNGTNVQFNGTQSFSLEAWVKPVSAVWGSIVSKFQHATTHEGYSLEMLSDYRPILLFGNNKNDYNSVSATTALTPNTWHHVAAVYNGSAVKIYVDGRLEGTTAWTAGITDPGTDLVIGTRMGTSVFATFFSGYIDEVRVWGKALTETEIREAMCRPLTGSETELRAYYRMDQTDGSTVYDYSGNGYNGTLTNMNLGSVWSTSDAFNVWIGETSSSWTAGSNWSKGSAPTSSQSVGIYKWALGNEATISSSPTVRNLLVSSTSSPTLSSALTVNRNLAIERNLDLNGQAITLGSTSYLLEGSGRLYGTSGTISTTRTLSSLSSVDIAGLGAQITTAYSMASTTITRGHAQQTGGGNVSILRYYDITPTNNSSLNASLIFKYNDAELNSLTESNLALFRSTDGGTTWTNQGGTLNTVSNTVTKTGISSFSRWTLADSAHPISKTTPVITFGPAPTPTYLGGNFTVSATTTNTDSSALTYSRVSGPCAFVSGATFSSTGAGTCVVQADGAATTNFNAASQTQSVTIGKAATATTIISDTPAPSVVGQAVMVSYTVTASPPAGDTPTGNVTVSDGVNNCSGTVAGGSCSLALTASGLHTLTATYGGDANFNGSTSSGAAHTVNKADTATAITSDNPDPSVVGQAVAVNFTVTATAPGGGHTHGQRDGERWDR